MALSAPPNGRIGAGPRRFDPAGEGGGGLAMRETLRSSRKYSTNQGAANQ